jgi:hypothetical protein
MRRREQSPTTVIGILVLVLALLVVSGCGSTTVKSGAPEPAVEAQQNASERPEAQEHAPVGPHQDFVTSCTRLNATRSLCRCFHEKAEAHETPAQIVVIEADMREGVPLAARQVGYVEECQK